MKPRGPACGPEALHGLLDAVAGDRAEWIASLPAALERTCRHLNWPVACAWIPRPVAGPTDGTKRKHAHPGTRRIWHLEDPKRFAALREATERVCTESGPAARDWTARVFRSGVAVFANSLAGLEAERRRAAAGAGLGSGCVLPISAEGKVVAVLELLREEDGEVSVEERSFLEDVRRLLDLLASRDRARLAVRQAALRLRALREELTETVAPLRSCEESFSLIRRAANDGLWEWEPREDVAHFSPRWRELLGLGEEEIGSQIAAWLDRIHPEDRERVGLELQDYLESGGAGAFESRHRVVHQDGEYRWVIVRALALRNEEGRVLRLAGSLTDITDLQRLEERTLRETLYHPLTSFPRPGLFQDRLEHAIRRHSRRPGSQVAVAAIELDGLQENDHGLGAQAREELLLAVARRLSAALRPGDSVGHGTEHAFHVLLEEVGDVQEARRVAERIHGGLARPFPVGDREIRLEPRLGLALFHSGYEKPEMLLLDAMLAMRRARTKKSGIEIFDPETRSSTDAVAQLEGDLRAAFTRDELSLEYQPIVSLDDGRIVGLEALVRWAHPSRGPIPPERFLAVAEETGLIEELGYWVLNRACRQMKEWDSRLTLDFPPSLAVNISERQFYDPALITTTTGLLKATGLEFSRLRFDVAEGIFTKDPSRATQILTALKARGIRVAIDDFGTGYSSISLLHRFPVNALKIDRWFVSGQTAKLREWDVAQTIIELARILGLEVVAEGVETREQFQTLRSLGCHQAQGFFFSGPVSPEEAARLVRDGYPLDLSAPTA